jgi:hypothetical protein
MRLNTFSQHVRATSLPQAFVDQIASVLESDPGAVICGSTAMYLHGALDRTPADLDVIASAPGLFEGLLESMKPEPTEADLSRVEKELPGLAKRAKDFYAYIEAVKYMLFGGNADLHNIWLTEEDYKRVSEIWGEARTKEPTAYSHHYSHNEGFTFRGSYVEHTKVCLFEAQGQVEYDTVSVGGMEVRVEKLEKVLEYKRAYGRDKDLEDLA